MSRNGRARRTSETLSESIDHRLNLYFRAAAAAGVSMLALAQPAEAEVVVTKTNIPITTSGTAVSIDLNKDGISDFQFQDRLGGYDHSFYATLAVAPLTGGEVVAGSRGSRGPYASALVRGANIGPSAHFSSSAARGQIVIERSVGFASGITTYQLYGDWGHVGSNRFLGVKFLIKGAIHYGWVRLTVNNSGRNSGTITGYAYETVANKKIKAGVSTDSPDMSTDTQVQQDLSGLNGPSLGMLALGADGLALWHRE